MSESILILILQIGVLGFLIFAEIEKINAKLDRILKSKEDENQTH